MRRVTRAGGVVAACTWNLSALERTAILWEEQIKLGPVAEKEQETARYCSRDGELTSVWKHAGLENVEETAFRMTMSFESFDDYWSPILDGVGPTGAYVARLAGPASWLVTGTGPAVALLVVPSVLVGIYLGPRSRSVQALVEPHRRALAAALILFIGSLIGIGLGPLAVGALSDALTPRLGADALRWALVGLPGIGLWAAAHYGLAARTLGAEAARLR